MLSKNAFLIVLTAFFCAGIVCIAVGLGLYFTAVNLPAGAEERGVRVLTGVVTLGVGALDGAVSGVALLVYLIRRRLFGSQD